MKAFIGPNEIHCLFEKTSENKADSRQIEAESFIDEY